MTRCACKGAELSCIIGNIFTELRPPCDMCGGEAVTLRGITPTGHEATITLTAAGFDFEGCAEDTALLQRIRKARWSNLIKAGAAMRRRGIAIT